LLTAHADLLIYCLLLIYILADLLIYCLLLIYILADLLIYCLLLIYILADLLMRRRAGGGVPRASFLFPLVKPLLLLLLPALPSPQ
jgi:hypothetical protein